MKKANFTVLHLGDVHVRPHKHLEIYRKAFNNFIKKVKVLQPDRIVIAGDLVHNKITVSNELYQMLTKLFNALCGISKVVVFPGNHDTILNSDRVDTITPVIEAINNPNIVYYTKSGVYPDKWGAEDIAWCIWSCMDKQADPEISKWQAENDPELKREYVALYHGVINGSKTAIGYAFEDGQDTSNFFNADVTMLADIHLHQEFKYTNFRANQASAVYCGSLIQQDFGETVDKHGFLEWSYDKLHNWSYIHHEVENEHTYHVIELDGFENLK